MKDKFLKIVTCFTVFLSMFIGSAVPAFAKDTYSEWPPAYDQTVYPYYLVIDNGDGSYRYVYAKEPFTVRESVIPNYRKSIDFYSSGVHIYYPSPFSDEKGLYRYEERLDSDPSSLIFSNYVDGDFPAYTISVYTSNHDIKNKDTGEVFFQAPTVPFLQGQGVEVLVEETTQNSRVIIGGTICLVVLGICLVGLVKRWRHLAQV